MPGLPRAPHVPGQLGAVIEPPVGPFGLKVTGAHPEGSVGEPGEEEALELGELSCVGQLYQVAWGESWSTYCSDGDGVTNGLISGIGTIYHF